MTREDELQLEIEYDLIRYHSKKIQECLLRAEKLYNKGRLMTFEEALQKVREDEKRKNISSERISL